jgi:leucyl aminopeptidase
MTDVLIDDPSAAVEILAVPSNDFRSWASERSERERHWLTACGVTGKAGQTALVADEAGRPDFVVHVVDDREPPIWQLAGLPKTLAEGSYRLSAETAARLAPHATDVALGWALGAYEFTRYRKRSRAAARLVWPQAACRGEVTALLRGIALARDLATTPAEDMGPAELADAVAELGRNHDAAVSTIVGDELLNAKFPAIHIVGRASHRAPRLIELNWGLPQAPALTLVGKGVCFDTGGLDLKSAAGMRLMKKDMGGAATLIGLAHAIMAMALPVRLRLLIPAVDNAVSANAYRPGDVIATRKGLSVEIGNTDAEGRLVLGDALALAMEQKPDLVIDMATLTGAARTALGPELPAVFANDEAAAEALLAAARQTHDPLWRMPLWRPYRKMLDSKIADINNASDSSYAGAITAALYLQEFVDAAIPWIHIDTFAWNNATRPGRPEGGEALGLRALFAMVKSRFA